MCNYLLPNILDGEVSSHVYIVCIYSHSRICAHLNEKENARMYYNKVSLLYIICISVVYEIYVCLKLAQTVLYSKKLWQIWQITTIR